MREIIIKLYYLIDKQKTEMLSKLCYDLFFA